jgi:LmbE family N-acetylglucosaminyl deacetylase
VRTAIAGRGTAEVEWAGWLNSRAWPALDLSTLPHSGRACVVAAHPDDEVLGAAGLITRLAHIGVEIAVVWATDGEASHPGSTVMSAETLGRARRAESRAALARLGIAPTATHHLALPDGQVRPHIGQLHRELAKIVDPDDLVIVPWEGDGHPDHEAVADAAVELGATRLQYPIWMWHWATPADSRVPWGRFHHCVVDNVSRKARAIQEFSTQVRPLGPAEEDATVLPANVLARFLRPDEWFVV